MGFNHINNKADHDINRPKYLTTESPQNIWELGKTPINKSVLKKKISKLSKQVRSKYSTIWVFSWISIALL